jgi:2-hydroxychromene-2-carboxylate isomerase
MATDQLDFYFDVLCPFTWRTSLWIRQAAKREPLEVTWKHFSLVLANDPELKTEFAAKGMRTGRTMVLAARESGNEAVDRLYLALGDAIHGRQLSPLDDRVMQEAAEKAGLPGDLCSRALADPTTETDYREAHAAATARGAFAAPTLALTGSPLTFFGPVLDPVPTGDQAAELWRHIRYTLGQPFLYELKRQRGGTPLAPQPAI